MELASPPRRPKNAYKLFFEAKLCELLAKGDKFRRDEVQAVTPTIKQLWMEAPPETIADFKVLAREDHERFDKEMCDFEYQHPELARELKIKEFQRKARSRRSRESKKVLKKSEMCESEETSVRRPSTAASKKVSSWLDQLTEDDLKAMDTSHQVTLFSLFCDDLCDGIGIHQGWR